ncbi:MAG: hypothetical protein CBB71_02705 [Rhodopirellula sp. TMED11]|nr:MAG: hypothetical protein CBB71_02705 [Rhodopirellula sp. TMED11]
MNDLSSLTIALWRCLTVAFLSLVLCSAVQSQDQPLKTVTRHYGRGPMGPVLAEYFQKQTDSVTASTFAEIKTLQDWTDRRQQYQQQLMSMLGLDPLPKKTDLSAVVTGTETHDGVIAEKLYFQSSPGLYVTANLYRPVNQTKPLPAILYVCGHGRVKQDGVSLGNKTYYHHHGAWFARNGYVCLTIDTIQLGEIEGLHHGTHHLGMWWWNSRGYTPAGVEAWNCIRALDYLESREEVDADRIGVTGRSGGGAYSWWIAAIDQRIKVAVPVAGITSMQNHVADHCVEGHCDCMFMLNTQRWDFPMVAALVAPRPLLIANSDKDRIFPLDGVVDVYQQTKQIYDLYDAGNQLGLHLTEGPHKDTQELRVGAFRWLNRFLKQDQELLQSVAVPWFEKSDLRVFETLPTDERVTTIHETFVPLAERREIAKLSDLQQQQLIEQVRQQCFSGWPDASEKKQRTKDLPLKVDDVATGSPAYRVELVTQEPFRLTQICLGMKSAASDKPVTLMVLDHQDWLQLLPRLTQLEPALVRALRLPASQTEVTPDAKAAKIVIEFERLLKKGPVVLLLARDVGPTRWTEDQKLRTHIHRRFMLLGQTPAAMQVHDILESVQTLRRMPEFSDRPFELTAVGDAALIAACAALFAPDIQSLALQQFPESYTKAPDIPNLARVIRLADLKQLAERQSQ